MSGGTFKSCRGVGNSLWDCSSHCLGIYSPCHVSPSCSHPHPTASQSMWPFLKCPLGGAADLWGTTSWGSQELSREPHLGISVPVTGELKISFLLKMRCSSAAGDNFSTSSQSRTSPCSRMSMFQPEISLITGRQRTEDRKEWGGAPSPLPTGHQPHPEHTVGFMCTVLECVKETRLGWGSEAGFMHAHSRVNSFERSISSSHALEPMLLTLTGHRIPEDFQKHGCPGSGPEVLICLGHGLGIRILKSS